MGSVEVSTVAGVGEDSVEAGSVAAVASGEAIAIVGPLTGLAGPQATRPPGRATAAAGTVTVAVTGAVTGAAIGAVTEATAVVGMTLVVLRAHLMTDMAAVAAATVTDATGIEMDVGRAVTWSPSGRVERVGIVTETTTDPRGTTIGSEVTKAAAGTTSPGRSAATNGGYICPHSRHVPNGPKMKQKKKNKNSGHWWYQLFFSFPFFAEGKQ